MENHLFALYCRCPRRLVFKLNSEDPQKCQRPIDLTQRKINSEAPVTLYFSCFDRDDMQENMSF